MFAEPLLVGRAGHQAVRTIPERRDDLLPERVRLAAPVRAEKGITQFVRHPRRRPQREHVEEVVLRVDARPRLAVLWNARVPPLRFLHPVNEAPAGQVFEEAVLVLELGEAHHRVAEAGEARLEPRGVLVPHHVVLEQHRPDHRVGGRFLRAGGGEVHRQHAVVAAAVVEERDRAANETVVAVHRRDRVALHVGVAHVHLLFVVRAVAHDLVHVHLHAADAHALHAGERRVVAFEMRGDRRRVARLDDAHHLQCQRLVRRLDLELAPAPGAPPRHAERRVRAPVGEEAVHEEVPGAALADELVAVALASVRIARALHPHPADLGPLAAAHDELRVRAVVVVEVEERAENRVRGDRHRLLFLEKRVQRLDERMARVLLRVEGAPVERRACGAERAGADEVARLVGQRRGEEHPPFRLHAADVEPHRAAHDLRRHVRRLGGTLLLERAAAHFGLRAHAEVAPHSLLAHRDVLQLRDAPGRNAGHELLVVRALRLEDEPAAPGKLGGRRIRPEHPHDGLHHVPARRELRLVGLVEPVLDDAPVRTERDRCAVQQQLETLVRAHV